ncbi:11977_t:CDS:2 [Acaulospora colombiana]|uniref:11977_t:CDS:1 n=1 Tax=Acaulospora colombiana TaxID=27376 RepID=A0ACA9KIR0_9GLOM|nr:11977_t:CDS:2 [Acaulospora colombiana]
MSAEESIYSRYKNATSVSTPPISPWALGIGNTPSPYPLSFKVDGTAKGQSKNRGQQTISYETEADQTRGNYEDLLTSYREDASKVDRSPSSSRPRSILAQTTPTKKMLSLRLDKTPPPDQKPTPRPSRLHGQSSFMGFDPFAHEHMGSPTISYTSVGSSVFKRPSQVSLSQFDEKLSFREDPSIATTFDPEKDKHLYETSLDLYRSFSKGSSKDTESFFWE